MTGLLATRPVPVFAELKTPAGTIAIGAPATVGMLGAAAPVPGQNRSVFIELRVDDVDAAWEQVTGLVPQTVPEIVLEPTDMPRGNRPVILRDPDGGLVNLFTRHPGGQGKVRPLTIRGGCRPPRAAPTADEILNSLVKPGTDHPVNGQD